MKIYKQEKKMELKKEEIRLIREWRNPYFTPEDIEKWLNIDLQATNSFTDYMHFTAAQAYLEAVRAELRRRQ